jgi:hypothetical protein
MAFLNGGTPNFSRFDMDCVEGTRTKGHPREKTVARLEPRPFKVKAAEMTGSDDGPQPSQDVRFASTGADTFA